MFMSDNKKKTATLVLQKLKGGSEQLSEAPVNEDGDELDQSAGYDAAGDELLQAIDSKDPKAIVSAIKSLVEMCMNEQPEADEADEASEV